MLVVNVMADDQLKWQFNSEGRYTITLQKEGSFEITSLKTVAKVLINVQAGVI